MNRKTNFYADLLFTVVVAFIIGGALYLVLLSIFANFDVVNEQIKTNINSFTSAVAGLLVGYRLATLVGKSSKKSKSRKK